MMIMNQVEVVRAACCVAAIDGQITAPELALIQKLADRVGIGKISLQAILDRAKSDPNFYQQQFQYLQSDAKNTTKILFTLAVADGVLTQEERVIIHHLATKLGLPQDQFDRVLAAAEAHIAKAGKPPKPGGE